MADDLPGGVHKGLDRPESQNPCKSEEPYLQFGYEVLTFPVAEFAQIFGPLIYAINQAWPVQVFGMGSQDELVELSFTK